MAQILLGKEVTASLNEEIEEKVKTLKEHQVMPKLGIIRIGEKQDDIAYERNAVKRCEKLSVAYEKVRTQLLNSRYDLSRIKIVPETEPEDENKGSKDV